MDEHFVINIGRQLGSGGRMVGEHLATRLGARFYDKELILMAAKQSGLREELFEQADERQRFGLKTAFTGLFSGLMNYTYPGETAVSSEALFAVQSEVIRSLADEGPCVFVGRCADYVLREHPRCVNVFISADAPARRTRVKELFRIDDDHKACELMERTDRLRASYYKFFSGKTWGTASSYHLCINSSVLGLDETTEFILAFAKQKLGL